MTTSEGEDLPETALPAFRPVVLVGIAGILAALTGEALLVPIAQDEALIPLTVLFGVCLLGFAWSRAGSRRKPTLALVAITLDIGAVLAGATLNAGNDAAVIMPLVGGVLLVSVLKGRSLALGLGGAWIAGIVGSAAAFSTPGLSTLTHAAPPALEASLAALMTFPGYVGLAWVSAHWTASAAAARQAAEQARRAEAAQYKSGETLRILADASPLPTLVFGEDGKIQFWSPAAESLLGWSADETIGQPVISLVPVGLRAEASQQMERALSEGQLSGTRETCFLCRDGSEARVEIYEAIERDAAGRPVGVVVQFFDVAEWEAMEGRLMEAQRLEAVGQLAGGIAHDFNNSLTAIAGFASLIAAGESADPRDDARTILAAADHAATLVRQMLAFSRRVPLEPKRFDLGDFLIDLVPLIRVLTGETISVQLDTDGLSAPVSVDPSLLEQAVLNLASNSRDAMPMGGELTVAVRSIPNCVAPGAADPEAHAAVIVSDTGEGISLSSMRHLFEPFFTTKAPGMGSGLGLAMVHGFVAQSGGHVVVTSPPGQGATVELHFPRMEGVASARDSAAETVGGSESILFVEDDPGVAAFGLACLRRLGYDVTPAMNGSEAAALAAAREIPFDLLLTDVVIPGMSGLELASIIRRRHPDTAILFASGYSSENIRETVLGPDAMLIQKPYSLGHLAATIREALADKPGATS